MVVEKNRPPGSFVWCRSTKRRWSCERHGRARYMARCPKMSGIQRSGVERSTWSRLIGVANDGTRHAIVRNSIATPNRRLAVTFWVPGKAKRRPQIIQVLIKPPFLATFADIVEGERCGMAKEIAVAGDEHDAIPFEGRRTIFPTEAIVQCETRVNFPIILDEHVVFTHSVSAQVCTAGGQVTFPITEKRLFGAPIDAQHIHHQASQRVEVVCFESRSRRLIRNGNEVAT